LLVLTDRSQLRLGRGLLRTLLECRDAGLTHVLLRELDLPDEHRAALVGDLAAAGLAVIAARRPLPAAAGVHLPAQQDPSNPADEAAARELPWGRSCHSAAEVARAADEGAAWATLSPYGESVSKPGYGPPVPASALAGHDLPVYALGGITPANADDALAAGAHGVAVMGEVMRSADPAATVRALLGAVG
jgi:thiamine-phosphate pyrophosphorylase